jgi:hypothetical protein
MSSFRTRLRQTAQPSRARQIGFGTRTGSEPSPQLLVVAIVEDASAVPALIDAGAGAFISTSLDSLEALVEAADDLPVGVRIDAASVADATCAQEAGVDFIAFNDAETEAEAFLEQEPGRVLLIESAVAENRLRLIAGMRLDAIIVAPPPQPLMVRDQLALRRIADVAGTPLIAPSGEAPSTASLHAWRNAGTLAVLVPGNVTVVAETVAAAIAVPAAQPVRDDDRRIALVPAVADSSDDLDDDDF